MDDQVGKNYLMHAQYDYEYTTEIKLTIRNSIFSARGPNSPIFIREGVDFSFEGCLFYFPRSYAVIVVGGYQGSGDPRERYIYGPEDVGKLGRNSYGDPLFVRTGFGDEGDYHLREGSPAIDLGVQVPLSVDLDGASRPHGRGFDAGAYEFGSVPAKSLGPPSYVATAPPALSVPSAAPTLTVTGTVVETDTSDLPLVPAVLLLIALLSLMLLRSLRRPKGGRET